MQTELAIESNFLMLSGMTNHTDGVAIFINTDYLERKEKSSSIVTVTFHWSNYGKNKLHQQSHRQHSQLAYPQNHKVPSLYSLQ